MLRTLSSFSRGLPFRSQAVRALLTGVLLLTIMGCGRFAYFLLAPPGEGKTVKLVDFAKGASLRRLADDLEKGGVLGSARLFVLYARLRGAASKVQAGSYQFSDALRPGDILRMLVTGEVYEKRFAAPEGYSMYQLAELLEGRGFFPKEDFLRQCTNPALLRELGIKGKSAEGFLFPSTYNLARIEDPAALVRTMAEQFHKVYTERFAPLERGSGLSRQQLVTLASMVEKEAIVPAERPIIASVFHNRLRKGMPLQSDPTAVYGVRAFAGKVSKQDIQRNSPYNTYLIRGLPPGPIGNPGSGAIEAVLQPARTSYYYFVAKNDGTHHFSATLDEHNRAVRIYLKGAPGNGAGLHYQNDRPNITRRR